MACTQVQKNDGKGGTCGKVMPFWILKICDPVKNESLGPYEIGEIHVNGPMVMKGYYRNMKATNEVFAPNGWLKSGDLGYHDADGYLYIVDRLKELIKYKGCQVYFFSYFVFIYFKYRFHKLHPIGSQY